MLSSSSPCSSDLANFASPDPKNNAWKENTPVEVNDEPLTPIPKNRGNLVSTACPSCHVEVLVDDLPRHLESHTAKQRREAGVKRREGGTPLQPLNEPASSDTRTTSQDLFAQKFRGFQPRPDLSIDVKRNLFGGILDRQAVDDDIGFKMRDFDGEFEMQGDFGRLSESFSFGRRDTPRLPGDLDDTTAKEQQQGSTLKPPASTKLYSRPTWYASHLITQSPQFAPESPARDPTPPVEESFWRSVGAAPTNVASEHDADDDRQICARSAMFGTDHGPMDGYCGGGVLTSQRSGAQDEEQSTHHSDSSRGRPENAPRRNHEPLARSATVPALAQAANDGHSTTTRHLSLPLTSSRRESHHSNNELLNDKLGVTDEDTAVRAYQDSVDSRASLSGMPLALPRPTTDMPLFDVSIEVRVTPVARAPSPVIEEQPHQADDNSTVSTMTNPKKRRRGLSFRDLLSTEPPDTLHPCASWPTMTSQTNEKSPSPRDNVCSSMPIRAAAATKHREDTHVPSYGDVTQCANNALFLPSSKAHTANSITRENLAFANCGPDSEAAREQAKAFFRTPSPTRPVQLRTTSTLPNLISLDSTPSEGTQVTPLAAPLAHKCNVSTLNGHVGPYRDLLSSSDKFLSPNNPANAHPPTIFPSMYVDLLELYSATSAYFTTSPRNDQTPLPITSPQSDFQGDASLSLGFGVQDPVAVDEQSKFASSAVEASLIPSPASSPVVPSLSSADAQRSNHASPILNASLLPSPTAPHVEPPVLLTGVQLRGINPIATESALSGPQSTFTALHNDDPFFPKQQEQHSVFSDFSCNSALFDTTQSFHSGHGSNVTPRNGIVKKNRHCLQETHTTVPWDNSTSLMDWSFNESTRNGDLTSRVTPRILQSARVALRSSLANESTFLPLPAGIGDTCTYADDISGVSKPIDNLNSGCDLVAQSHNPIDRPLPRLHHADEVRQSKLVILKARKKRIQNTINDTPPAIVPQGPPPPETNNSHDLASCPHCLRKFLQVALKRHLPVCLKVFGTIRDPVDFRAKRAKDTPLEYFVPGTSTPTSTKGADGSLNTSMHSNLNTSIRSQSMPPARSRTAKLTPSTFRSKGTYPCTPSVSSTSMRAPSLSTSTTARSGAKLTPSSTSTYVTSAAARKDRTEHRKLLDSARRALVMDRDNAITTAAKAKPKYGPRPQRSTLPQHVPQLASDAPMRRRIPLAKAKAAVMTKTPAASSSQLLGHATSSGSRGSTEKHNVNRQNSQPRAPASRDVRQTRGLPSSSAPRSNIQKVVTPAPRPINPRCDKKDAAPHAKRQVSVKHVIQEKTCRNRSQAMVNSDLSSRQKRPDDGEVPTSQEGSTNLLAPVEFFSTNQYNETPSDGVCTLSISARDEAPRNNTSTRYGSPREPSTTSAHEPPLDGSSLLSTSARDVVPRDNTLTQYISPGDTSPPFGRQAPTQSLTPPSISSHNEVPPNNTSTRHTSLQGTSAQGPMSMLEAPRIDVSKMCISPRENLPTRYSTPRNPVLTQEVSCKSPFVRYAIPENQVSAWKAPCHNAPTRHISPRDITLARGAPGENMSLGPKRIAPIVLCEDEVSCGRPSVVSTSNNPCATTHARYRDSVSPPQRLTNPKDATYPSARSSLDFARDAMRRHASGVDGLGEVPRPLLNESRRRDTDTDTDVSPLRLTCLPHNSSPLRHPSPTPMRWGTTHLSPESIAFRKRRESHEEWHGVTVSSRLVDLQTEMSLLEDRLIRPKMPAPAEKALSQLSAETKALTERVDRLLRRSPHTPEAVVSKQVNVSSEKTSTLLSAETVRYIPSRYAANK